MHRQQFPKKITSNLPVGSRLVEHGVSVDGAINPHRHYAISYTRTTLFPRFLAIDLIKLADSQSAIHKVVHGGLVLYLIKAIIMHRTCSA
jgi:hypothetical protein